MEHNHGNEYQIKVIHEDGTEVLSEWIEHENVEQTMATLRDSKARGYWLRERMLQSRPVRSAGIEKRSSPNIL